MSQPGSATVPASHPFFDSLGEPHRTLLTSHSRPFVAAPDELLVREGDTANSFYLIEAGHVALALSTPDRGAVPIQTAGAGDIVGWSWLLPPHRWQFECRAVDDVRGLAIDAAWLREQCEKDHELGYQLLKQLVAVIANRLAATRLQLLDIYR